MHIDYTDPAFQASQSYPKPAGQSSGTVPPRPTSFWSEFISHAAEAAGIDPRLALQVALHESDLNPQAVNRSSGAVGMMQLLPATAAALGVDPHNVAENIRGGLRYLHEQMTKFGDTAQALAAYNWGPGHVAHAIARWGGEWLNHAPNETRHYVASILTHAGIQAQGENGVLASNQSNPAPVPSPTLASVAERGRVRQALQAYLLSALMD